MKELKEYFENYILIPISELLNNQRIYKDFQKNCMSKNFISNSFTAFVDIIYYKTMITDLCRQLDKPKNDSDRTFRGFIERFKAKEHIILDKRKNQKVLNLKTGTIQSLDGYKNIKPDFDSIAHDEKIKELEKLFQIFRLYRNKVNCHLTSEEIEPPTIEQIDKAVSFLEELLYMYANLFGMHIVSIIPNPVYENPPFVNKL
ncbi:MAG: hypothetical protein SPI34_00890 [Opitutales bacterium]|nr:hypothetical protein [Opitutales bacterium]